MVRPTPPVEGQTEWAQPLLDCIEYATDTAEEALSAVDAMPSVLVVDDFEEVTEVPPLGTLVIEV